MREQAGGGIACCKSFIYFAAARSRSAPCTKSPSATTIFRGPTNESRACAVIILSSVTMSPSRQLEAHGMLLVNFADVVHHRIFNLRPVAVIHVPRQIFALEDRKQRLTHFRVKAVHVMQLHLVKEADFPGDRMTQHPTALLQYPQIVLAVPLRDEPLLLARFLDDRPVSVWKKCCQLTSSPSEKLRTYINPRFSNLSRTAGSNSWYTCGNPPLESIRPLWPQLRKRN